MARCEECIHEKVCVIKAFPDAFENTQWDQKPCNHFRYNGEVAKEFTCFVGDPHKVEHCPYLDEIEKAKAEVAREIFEEIEKRVRFEAYDLDDLVIDLAELKKKYTEGDRREQVSQ